MRPPVRTFVFALVVLVTVILVGSVRAEVTARPQTAAQPDPQSSQPPSTGAGQDNASLEALGGDEKPVLEGGAPVAAEDLVFSTPSPPTVAADGTEFQAAPNSPTITIWYGTNQTFGQNGDPQKWVNILGKVTNATPISSLTYSLNGGAAQPLTMGPDQRRLTQAGHFIVEIDYTDLQDGVNLVAITADDGITTPTVASVTLNYDGGNNFWTPGTYTYDWSAATTINDHGQVVTGEWTLNTAQGLVKPVLLAYDRLIAMGDMTWRDYTVTVPITIYSIDEGGFPAPSNGPAVGVLVRWQGHFDLNDISPRVGWRRLGALAWYRWGKTNGVVTSGMQMLGHGGLILAENDKPVQFGQTYMLKVQIQSNGTSQPATYRFKMWNVAETEPTAWDFEEPGKDNEPAAGSLMLLAHHVEAEFGTVTVQLNSTQPLPTLTVNTIGNGTGTVARAPSKNPYLFGEDVQLTANPGPDSTFAGWSGALGGTTNPAALEMFGDRTVTAVFTSNSAPDTPISDDFSGCVLNNDVWAFVNPLGDATLTMNGTQAQIAIPAGTKHDLFGNDRNAPRLMQFVENEDFEIEAKFDATMNARTQMQGILVEADAQNYLRFNFQWDNTAYKIFALKVTNGSPATQISQTITGSVPIYLQVQREGDNWTVRHSANGNTWTSLPAFTHALSVTSAGVYVGTAGQNPAFTGLIDYFFDTDKPIDPEDGPITLDVTEVGNGTVTVDPEKATYTCGEEVDLIATPDSGWFFNGWSGDVGGTDPSITITMDRAKDVTATFTSSEQYTLTVIPPINGSVTKNPDQPTYEQGTVVTLTAVPSAEHSFGGWGGDLSGNENPTTIIMEEDKAVSANFFLDQYTLDVTLAGSGSVTKSPDKPLYYQGEVVKLTAVPGPESIFASWTGDIVSAVNPVEVTMTGNTVVTANFVESDSYSLTVNIVGDGEVDKNPDKLEYDFGEPVTLTATAGAGSFFAGWSGDATGTANPLNIDIVADTVITATFGGTGQYVVNVATIGQGSVTKEPDKTLYAAGEPVRLTAVGEIGHKFISWGGSVVSAVNPLIVTVNQNMNLTATFQPATPYTLNLTTNGNGSATAVIAGAPNHPPPYLHGEMVKLTAVAASGYTFAGWSGSLISNANPAVLLMDGNKTVVANFTNSADPQSDDFGSCTLNNRWQFVNPRQDGTYSVNGSQLSITIPGVDSDHNIWKEGNNTARLLQPAANTDFELQAKFESAVSARYQIQGILVEESPERFLRFDFFSDGASTGEVHVYAASIDRNVNPPDARVQRNVIVKPPADGDLYLRIQRIGDKWFYWYSFDGENWVTTGGNFTDALKVNRVGVYAGNTGSQGNIPAHTAVIDYFFNNASPVDPEDGATTIGIDMTIVGQGQVNRNPNKESYACGEQVQLTAVPNPGWRFVQWSGDLAGTNPVASLTIDGPQVITATFAPIGTSDNDDLYLPAVLR